MKKINDAFFWLLLFPLLFGSCVGEDYSNCITKTYIRFESKNPKHPLREITKSLELYLYGADNRLAHQFNFLPEDFSPSEVAVEIPEIPGGTYKIIGVINHESCYSIYNIENLDEVYTVLNNDTVDTPPADLFVGSGLLTIKQNKQENTIITTAVAMGKQTNHFKVNITFDGYTSPAGTSINSCICGYNGKFLYNDYICPDNEYKRVYLPHQSTGNTNGTEPISYNFTTMRLWIGADLTLLVEEHLPSLNGTTRNTQTRKVELNIVDLLKEIEEVTELPGEKFPYNSDEKLEFHDVYNIDVTLGANFVVLGIKINDWTVIGGGVEV